MIRTNEYCGEKQKKLFKIFKKYKYFMCIRARGLLQPSQELGFDSGNKSSEPARPHLPLLHKEVATPEASAQKSKKQHNEDGFPSQSELQ